MLPNFIGKVTVAQRNCLTLNGRLVLEQYQDLRTYLIGALSRETTALFAEPVITRRGDEIDIAWYAEPSGKPISLGALDVDAQAVVVSRLKACLETIAPLLSGPSGALLGRALYLMDFKDILAVGQEPLLIQWSIVPNHVNSSHQAALDAHFATALGRYVSIRPPLISPRSSAAVPIGVTPGGAPPIQSRPSKPKAAGTIHFLSRQDLVLVTAVTVAALFALLFTFPDILASPAAEQDHASALSDARQITKSMREQVAQAQKAMAVANCDPDGRVTTPDGQQGQLPPPPIPIRPAEGPANGNMALVARRATEAVVFIFTCTNHEGWEDAHKNDKEKGEPLACPKLDDAASEGAAQSPLPDNLVVLGSGSGFFVAPKTVVTNFHVVRSAQAVFVTSSFLGRAKRAKVEATTPPGVGFVSPDFAVLSLDIDNSPPPIELAIAPSLLENVVAAGFPGVVINEDIDRDKLLQGDMTAVPGLTTFPGAVTLIKYPDQPMQLIYSSAVIGHGNSGGPLLDLCARALGMNTFGWSGTAEDTGYKVNIAEGAKALSTFLDENHVAHAAVAQTCEPAAQANNQSAPPKTSPSPSPNMPPEISAPMPVPPQAGKGK